MGLLFLGLSVDRWFVFGVELLSGLACLSVRVATLHRFGVGHFTIMVIGEQHDTFIRYSFEFQSIRYSYNISSYNMIYYNTGIIPNASKCLMQNNHAMHPPLTLYLTTPHFFPAAIPSNAL
jgi:hypothetical protein